MLTGEREQLLAALESAAARAEPVALVTVVGAEGSVYRRTGARMLIGAGESVGAVSGGCLEGDLRHHALAALESGDAAVLTYDTRERDDAIWGSGAGCRGVVDVLLEPIAPDRLRETLDFYRRALRPESRTVLATLVRSTDPEARLGARLVVTRGGVEEWNGGERSFGRVRDAVVADALAQLESRRSERRSYHHATGTLEVELEVVEPPVRLLVLGAGADAVPVTGFARALGWRVVVVDHRAAFALPERFPAAERVLCSEPERLKEQLRLDDFSAVVIMTHSYPRDRIYLELLLRSTIPYVGMLGPRSRTEGLLEELAADGIRFPAELLDRVHGPVGLDLGSETPESIALSIVAEVHAVLAGRRGGLLRDRRGAIHVGAPDEEATEEERVH